MTLSDYISLTTDSENSVHGNLLRPQYLTEIMLNIYEYVPQMDIVDAFNIAIQIQRNQVISCAFEVEENSECNILNEIKNKMPDLEY